MFTRLAAGLRTLQASKPLCVGLAATAAAAVAPFASVARAETAPTTLRVGLCQILVTDDKQANIVKAKSFIGKASKQGAKLVSLPECWNSPYATSSFPVYAETIPAVGAKKANASESPSVAMLLQAAKENKVWLIGGSIPERDGSKVYNTCVVVSPDGEIVAKHRKVHLFDIDVPGKITFRESDTLTGGDSITTFRTEYGTIGVGICYDMRFPELAGAMRQRGCNILVYPGAFNMTTGPAHWELLQRGRALDNQAFVLTVSPARNPSSSYQAWGHSSIVGPWGDVRATTEHEESLVIADLDLEKVDEVRRNIPTSKQKRHDLYALVDKTI